jgi:NitT/TauT family transport system ATP-binding protein
MRTTAPSPLGIELDGVGRTFGSDAEAVAALEGISLQIGAGRFESFVGPSGCGKTTLLRLIGALDRPTAGRVVLRDDHDAEVPAAGALGFCFQDARLMPWRTAVRNVALPLELAGQPPAARQSAAQALLERVGLAQFSHARPHELSGGMQMRVALARALITRPRVLLLDEPFGALDEITRAHLDDELRALWRDHGMTAVMITHSISEAIYVSDRVHVLSPRPGRVIESIDVDLPDEARTAALRGDSRFVALVTRAQAALARGVQEAMT